MLNKKEKTLLNKLRKSVQKELKRLQVFEPKITLGIDYRTKRLKLIYRVYVDGGFDATKKRKVSKKKKELYLKNLRLTDGELLMNKLETYARDIVNEVTMAVKTISSDKDTLGYWQKLYSTNPVRYSNVRVSPSTLKRDEQATRYLLEYVLEKDKSMNNIWKWVDNGKDFLTSYMNYRQEYGGNKKKWSNNTVLSEYARVRAMFNYIGKNYKGFPDGILNGIQFSPYQADVKSFTPQEIDKIKNFIEEQKDTKEWGWFIPMFYLMLETGVRAKELCTMKITDIEVSTKEWLFSGKGRFGGKERKQRIPDDVWNMMLHLIADENGNVRTDKEYVFHREFYRKSYDTYYLVKDLDKHIATDGYQKKFKKMVELLKLNKKLSPHSCRRYFITEMLIKTNGNIPLVAQLVGHSSWDMVKRYAQSVIPENEDTNVGLFSKVSVPIMITQAMRKKLFDMGYTKEKVSTLKPEQAHEIIQRGF